MFLFSVDTEMKKKKDMNLMENLLNIYFNGTYFITPESLWLKKEVKHSPWN